MISRDSVARCTLYWCWRDRDVQKIGGIIIAIVLCDDFMFFFLKKVQYLGDGESVITLRLCCILGNIHHDRGSRLCTKLSQIRLNNISYAHFHEVFSVTCI